MMQEIQWDNVDRGDAGGIAIVPRRNGYAVIPGNARGPHVPKPSPQKSKRKTAKASRKRNRGTYNGQ